MVVVLIVVSGDRSGTSACFGKGEGRAIRHCYCKWYWWWCLVALFAFTLWLIIILFSALFLLNEWQLLRYIVQEFSSKQ